MHSLSGALGCNSLAMGSSLDIAVDGCGDRLGRSMRVVTRILFQDGGGQGTRDGVLDTTALSLRADRFFPPPSPL